MSKSNQALTPSDLEEGERIFEELSLPIDRMRFHYDDVNDCWCLSDGLDGSVKATRSPAPNAIEWTVA